MRRVGGHAAIRAAGRLDGVQINPSIEGHVPGGGIRVIILTTGPAAIFTPGSYRDEPRAPATPSSPGLDWTFVVMVP